MNFSKSLIAISGIVFLASCTNNQYNTDNVNSTKNVEQNNKKMMDDKMMDHDKKMMDTQTYTSPAWKVSVKFTTTKEWDVIKTASVDFVSGDNMSENFVKKFSDELSTVVGKKISEISNIKAIWGASLTTAAFIEYIK